MTDTSLLALAALPHLLSLDLSGCVLNPKNPPKPSPQVTDTSLLALAALPHLLSLDVSGCVAATERGFGALAARLRLHTLRVGGTSRVATVQASRLEAVWGLGR